MQKLVGRWMQSCKFLPGNDGSEMAQERMGTKHKVSIVWRKENVQTKSNFFTGNGFSM